MAPPQVGFSRIISLHPKYYFYIQPITWSTSPKCVVKKQKSTNFRHKWYMGDNHSSRPKSNRFHIWLKSLTTGRIFHRSSGGSGSVGGGMGGGSGGGSSSAGGKGKGGAHPLLAFWMRYNQLLESRPLLTKALTSLIGFILGDILAQKFLSSDGIIHLDRLFRMAAFGFLIHGPTGHIFYSQLDKAIPGTEAWKVACKVAIDQVLWAPIFAFIFFGFLAVLERQSFEQFKAKLRQDWKTAIFASWKVWPLAHAINFRFVPSNQRLLYINAVQIFYNVFLSIIGNKRAT
ncbi:hypothetical protein GAYE_SCF08G3001 [Galdieria yellowstonensis]|uniref:Peroxisomal membrane MPV17/PMP22-like protein n=1 Tax=Galdieria yellowstonensis TaxID=3028027 RepID=A0AAV9ID69_9RHOD|nr:hypothetical protein GAYE_SCF08G3001 [Galdieria yellowstonensis]